MNSAKIPLWGKMIPNHELKSVYKEYNILLRPYLIQKAKEIPYLEPFLIPSPQPQSTILIAPGGGYFARAPHEAKPIAKWLNSIGFSVFILNYRHAPFRHPIPFLDAQRALRLIRYNAHKFNIRPDRVGMIGFSAGGHLTAMLGTLANQNWFPAEYVPDQIDLESALPNFMILCYPVISMQYLTHKGSRFNLLGKHPDVRLIQQLSVDTQVSSATPPAFLWTTRTDNLVPYQHTEMFSTALQKHGVNHETHIFFTGLHGLGLATQNKEVSRWTHLCENWLQKMNFR